MGSVESMASGRKWGGVARRGADNVAPEKRQAQQRGQGGRGRDGRGQGGGSAGQQRSPERKGAPELGPPPAWEPEEWIQEPDVRAEAGRAVARGTKEPRGTKAAKVAKAAPDRPRRKAPADVARDISSTVGAGRAGRVEQRLMEAARTFERERYRDADRMLRTLLDRAPDVPAVRELHGLNLYRLGRWNEAAKQLELFRQQTGSVEQHPVLADCYRALRRHTKAQKLWDELRAADAPAEVVTEGRIVAAGSLADRGKIAEAIRLLEKGPVRVKKPKDHHVRLWYALADLYERAGDNPRARDLFARVAQAEPDFADAAERLAALD
jgi:tetratricopeptide (TPR) repeat protein